MLSSLADWLPPYTEQWATTYLQVLFEGFLFALGVPTAIYSLIVDNDIKRVAQTRVKARRYFVVTALLYVAVFMIVWFLHPDPTLSPSRSLSAPQEAAAVRKEDLPLAPATHSESDRAIGSPEGSSIPSAATWKSTFKSVFAASTVTFLPFAVLITGLTLNNQFKREKVVEHLASELLKRLDADQSIDIAALRDLSYLGEHGRAGNEKGMVLDVIDRLAETVQQRVKAYKLKYYGYELESLIRHIPAMLDNASQPGDDQNYRRAVELLANIWRWVGMHKVSDDALSTREALRHLALRSVETMAEETSLAYLEIAADCDSHMVFDIGLAAISDHKYVLATAVLTKLEALASIAVEDKEISDSAGETRANLVGIAALLAADGPSGTLRAETSLHLNEELFSPSLRKALADATNYHYGAGRFEIADKIRLLIQAAETMKTIDLDRSVPYITPTPETEQVQFH